MTADDYEVTLVTDGRAGFDAAARGDHKANARCASLHGRRPVQRSREGIGSGSTIRGFFEPAEHDPRMTSSPSRAREPLLFVGDDATLGLLTAELLRADFDVTLVTTGASGYREARRRRFVAMLVDRGLPDMDGLEVVDRLRSVGDVTPIILLTTSGAVCDRVAGIESGADDYVVKPFDVREVVARIRAITRSPVVDKPAIVIGDWEFRADERIATSRDAWVSLTETEARLLAFLVHNRGLTVSRDVILREVFASGESAGTVDTYVHYLRRKTDRGIVRTMRGRGYRVDLRPAASGGSADSPRYTTECGRG